MGPEALGEWLGCTWARDDSVMRRHGCRSLVAAAGGWDQTGAKNTSLELRGGTGGNGTLALVYWLQVLLVTAGSSGADLDVAYCGVYGGEVWPAQLAARRGR